MQKAVIVAVVVLVCLPALLYAKGTRANHRRSGTKEGRNETTTRPKDCGQWTDGQCTLKDSSATCGKGNMVKTRTGDNCPVKEKTVKCDIACPGAPARGSGGRNRNNNRKTACKYTKGQWSECDTATNTRTRTLTLKTSRRNAAPSTDCEPTKVLTKRCTVNRKNRRGQQ